MPNFMKKRQAAGKERRKGKKGRHGKRYNLPKGETERGTGKQQIRFFQSKKEDPLEKVVGSQGFKKGQHQYRPMIKLKEGQDGGRSAHTNQPPASGRGREGD